VRVRLVPVEPDLPGSFQGMPRARHPRRRNMPWIGLWPRLRFPTTQRGLLLWQDGRVLQMEEWGDLVTWEDADAHILGGYRWEGEDTDWIAQVLVANGYTLEALP
jgi:hypothetical protein